MDILGGIICWSCNCCILPPVRFEGFMFQVSRIFQKRCQRLDTLSFPPSSFWNNKDHNLFCTYEFIQISFSLLSLFVCLLLAFFCIFIECNCSYFRPMPSLLNDWNWKSKRLWLKLCVSCIKPHYMDWSRYQRGRKLFLRKVLLLYH